MTRVFKPTCDLYDEHLASARVLTIPLINFGGVSEFCGTAVTVKCFEDNSQIRELVAMAGKGRVLVVDGGGSLRCALVGDVLAGEAQRNGWSGVIVHGCVRDKAALRELGLGVMALGVTPRKSVRRGEGQRGIPIQLGDVWCHPGDVVYGDDDGVVLLDSQ